MVRQALLGAPEVWEREAPMIVRFEQINARGEASRPRVHLIARALLDRAALGVEMLRLRLRAAGRSRPGRP